QADHRGADAHAGEPGFGDRRIDDPALAEAIKHPLADLVRAVILRHFLAHEEDTFVALHFLGHGQVERFAVLHDGHASGHSCGMCGAVVISSKRASGAGPGALLANSIASSISCRILSWSTSRARSSIQPRSLRMVSYRTIGSRSLALSAS